MKKAKKILVNFQIGRGGRFNNQGYLTFLNVGTKAKECVENKNFIRYENEADVLKELQTEEEKDSFNDLITDLNYETEGALYDELCKKYGPLGGLELHYNGNYIGDCKIGEFEYHYDVDGDYDTTYGVLIEGFEDLSERQQQAVLNSNNKYDLELELDVKLEEIE